MKINCKTMVVVMAMVILSIPAASAQGMKQNVFKVNLLSPLVRTGSFFYERLLNEESSVQLGLFYTGASFGDTQFRGFGITPEYRFYLSEKPAPRGVFVAPFLRYQNFNLTDEVFTDDKAKYSSYGGGLLVGAQTVFKDMISLEAFIGPSYYVGDMNITSGEEGQFDIDNFDGFGVRFGVTIGVLF